MIALPALSALIHLSNHRGRSGVRRRKVAAGVRANDTRTLVSLPSTDNPGRGPGTIDGDARGRGPLRSRTRGDGSRRHAAHDAAADDNHIWCREHFDHDLHDDGHRHHHNDDHG
jgi:hypothetical protein